MVGSVDMPRLGGHYSIDIRGRFSYTPFAKKEVLIRQGERRTHVDGVLFLRIRGGLPLRSGRHSSLNLKWNVILMR